ncbi:hypothetical protein [Jejuia pallidilutea]|uniref:hypothetical protein n=1 Tax=Jejuia pallidilutea TaxID=504487 RepID=UPI0005A6FA2D
MSKFKPSVKSPNPNVGLKSNDSNNGISKAYSIPISPATKSAVSSVPFLSFLPSKAAMPPPAPTYQLKFPSNK